MDISIITGNEIKQTGFAKCSGYAQLFQTVASDLLREINTVIGVGSGLRDSLSSITTEVIKAKIVEAIERTKINILNNQKYSVRLQTTETLKDIKLTDYRKVSVNEVQISLLLTTTAGAQFSNTVITPLTV